MQINVPSPSLQSLSGYKTYVVLASGAIVIALNHFGLLPPGYVKLDPNDWITEEYQLLLGATGRSAIASLGPVIAKYIVGHPSILPLLLKAQADAVIQKPAITHDVGGDA